MILMIIRSAVVWLQDSFKWCLKLLKYTVLKAAILSIAVISLLWLSVFLYASFYYVYMPVESHVRPVYFSFRVCETGEGLCSFPTANISLLKDNKEEVLARGQVYRIILELDLPESPTNQHLGMFMVNIEMIGEKGAVVQSSSRAAILRFKSRLLRVIDTLVLTPLFVTGMAEQKQVLPVELFPHYVDDAFQPSVCAKIEIQNRKIQLYSATLKIYAHFTGLRYLMFNWPMVCAVFGVGTNMFFLSAIALLSWYQFFCSDPSNVNIASQLEFQDHLTLEERRKKIRAILEKERQNQPGLQTPASVRLSRVSSSGLLESRMQKEMLECPETIHPEFSHSSDNDKLTERKLSSDIKEDILDDEETILLSVTKSGATDTPDEGLTVRHRQPTPS